MRASSLIAVVAAAAVLAMSPRALAYCRTTTCNSAACQKSPECMKHCPRDPDCFQCFAGGLPLFWPGCTSFSVQQSGSMLLGIDAEHAQTTIRNAFSRWLSADCGNQSNPSIRVYDSGLVACDKEEQNTDAPNVNVWMFRDVSWSLGDEKVAVTTVSFNPDTGEIRGADVEINSAMYPIVAPEPNGITLSQPGSYDLAPIVTHEAGHFLGLSHSCDYEATMQPNYSAEGATLAADDIAAVCAAYAPGAEPSACDPTPPHGFSATCDEDSSDESCACRLGAHDDSSVSAWILVALVAGGVRRRSRIRRA